MTRGDSEDERSRTRESDRKRSSHSRSASSAASATSSSDQSPSPPPRKKQKKRYQSDNDDSDEYETRSSKKHRTESRGSMKKRLVPAMVKEQMSDKHKRSGAGIINLLARIDLEVVKAYGFSAEGTKVPDKIWSFEIYHGGKLHKNKVVNKLEIPPKPWFVVGREYDNDVIVMEKRSKISISRRHCVVSFKEDGRPVLFDLNSTHGTFVNDMSGQKLKNDGRIKPGVMVPVHPGNRIMFGRCGYQYSLVYDGWKVDEAERLRNELRARADSARRGGRGRGRGGSFRTLAQIHREASKMKAMAEDQKKNFGVMLKADTTAIPSLS